MTTPPGILTAKPTTPGPVSSPCPGCDIFKYSLHQWTPYINTISLSTWFKWLICQGAYTRLPGIQSNICPFIVFWLSLSTCSRLMNFQYSFTSDIILNEQVAPLHLYMPEFSPLLSIEIEINNCLSDREVQFYFNRWWNGQQSVDVPIKFYDSYGVTLQPMFRNINIAHRTTKQHFPLNKWFNFL